MPAAPIVFLALAIVLSAGNFLDDAIDRQSDEACGFESWALACD